MQKIDQAPLAILAAIALCACGPNDDPGEFSTDCVDYAPAPADATFVVGREEGGSFSPLASGDTLPIDYGNQGGQHFFIAARLLGDGSDYTLRFTYTVDGQTHGSVAQRVESCDTAWTAVSNVAVVLNSDESVSGTLNVMVDGANAPPPVDVSVSVSSQ